MIREFDPKLIREAIDFYRALISGGQPKNPHSFPTEPNDLIQSIQRSALRVDRDYMDRISARLERVSNEVKSAKQGGPFGSEIPKADIGLPPEPAKLAAITRNIDLIRKQYEPVPPTADAFSAIHDSSRVLFESMALAGLMKAKGYNLDQAVGSKEFASYQKDLTGHLSTDLANLKRNPAAMRYMKDYPAFNDALRVGFQGPLGALQIPLREVIVHALAAAQDPDVQAKALAFTTGMGEDKPMEQRWGDLKDSINKSITKAYFSRDIVNRRLPVDLLLDVTTANPALWAHLGLPGIGGLNQNIIWKGAQELGSGAMSLRNRYADGLYAHTVDFFRDRKLVQADRFTNNLFSKLETYLGPETGPEIVKQVRANIEAKVSQIAGSVQSRIEIAKNIYSSMQDGVRSIFADLTPEQKVAVLYMQQDANGQAPAAAQAVMNTPEVATAFGKTRNLIDNLAKVDPQIPQRSGYWPAFSMHVEDMWDALKAAALRPYARKRIETELVHAGVDNVDSRIDDLVLRAAMPHLNSIRTASSDSAHAIAALAMDSLDEFIKTPQKISIINSALQASPMAKMGNLGGVLSGAFNFGYLAERKYAWMLGDTMDKLAHLSANVIERAKSGKAVSFASLFDKSTFVPPDIVENGLASQLSMNDVKGWGLVSQFRRAMGQAFKENAMADQFMNGTIYKFNYGSELKDIAQKTGVPLELLGEEAKTLAAQTATDATRKFAAAYSFSSAFTINPITKMMSPFMGFFIRSAGRTAQLLGDTPELYRIGAAALNQVQQMDREYPQDFKREVVSAFGWEMNPFRRLPIYPVIKAMSSSYYGDVQDRQDALEQKAQEVSKLPDMEARFKVINEDPQLEKFLIQRQTRYLGNFVQLVKDSDAIPMGFPVTKALEMAGQMDERTPHLIPGGRQISNLFRGLGMDNVDPEGAFIPRVKAYNENLFDADVAKQMLIMRSRGETDQYPRTPEGMDQMEADAKKQVRVHMLKDFLGYVMLGVKQSDAPEVQRIYNGIQEMNDKPHLYLPSWDESNNIRQATGIDDQHAIDTVWRAGFMNNPMKRQATQEAIRRDQMHFLQNFPEVPNTDPITEFRNIESQRMQNNRDNTDKSAWGIFQRTPNNYHEMLANDRTARATFYSYGATEKTDENGHVIGMKFDFDPKVPNLVRDFVWNFFQMSPQEQLDQFKKNDPNNSLIYEFFPRRFAELRNMAPETSNGFYGYNPSKAPASDYHNIVTAPMTIEQRTLGDRVKPLFDAIKELHPENPLDFPVNAWKYYLKENPDVIDQVKAAGKKITGLINNLNPFQVDTAYGADMEQMKTAREIAENPQTPAERQVVTDANRAIQDIAPLYLSGRKGDLETARMRYRLAVQTNPMVGSVMQWKRPTWMNLYAGIDKVTGGQPVTQDLIRLGVNDSIASDYLDWKTEAFDMLRNPEASQKQFQDLMTRGNIENDRGVKFTDALRYRNPGMIDELDLRSKGYRYALGNYVNAEFPPGQVADRKLWFDVSHYKPGETKTQYDARVTTLLADPSKIPPVAFDAIVGHLKDKGQDQTLEAVNKVRAGQYTKIPLDALNRQLVDSTKQYVYDNIDDPAGVYTYFKQNPETTELVRQFDPKTYRIVENKIFSPTDTAAMNYMKGSGYDPESLDYVRRHNPNTFNRLYFKNPEFQAVARSLGMPPTEPTEDTAVTVQRYDRSTQQMVTRKVASILAEPEPMLPEPVPAGVFDSFPNAINYVERRARKQASILRNLAINYPQNLTPDDVQFLNSSPEAQVFRSFPGVVGQAFREGKLSPHDVISQLKGLADYGGATGALDPASYDKFTTFLGNTASVFGAANFGFRLGQFLDDTFNLPRIPIQSKTLDFLLAGRPMSSGAVTDVALRERPALISPIAPSLVGAPEFQGVPISGSNGAAKGAQESADAAALTGAASGVAAGATAAAPVASTGVGLPVAAVIFAVVSAGFTISSMIQSGRARKKAASAAAAAEASRQQALADAKLAAQANQREDFARQAAQQRYQQMLDEEKARTADFASRANEFLRNGATMASFSQQPKEFQQRFTDKFQPELLQFSRRPQFQSRVNLIESVQGRIPKARY